MAHILMLGLLLLVAASFPAQADDLGARDWSVKAKASFDKSPPAPEDVRAFVIKTLDAEMNPLLCSFKFIDVNYNGTYILVASLDTSGRHFCNELVVIGRKGANFTMINQWKVWDVDDIGKILHDLHQDGHVQLVVPQSWAQYEGASHCLPTWQTILQWEGNKFIDRSSMFPEFYKVRRQTLKTAYEQSMGYGEDAICQQMEMDKIDRFLMTEPRAGFTRAEEWMKSNDASLRRKAAAVFSDIGDADSRDDLKKLTDDPNSLVAGTAKLYLGE